MILFFSPKGSVSNEQDKCGESISRTVCMLVIAKTLENAHVENCVDDRNRYFRTLEIQPYRYALSPA